MLLNEFDVTLGSGFYVTQGIYQWQLRRLERELGSIVSPEPELTALMASWNPPNDLDSRDWRPLTDLWPPPPGMTERELHVYGILLVSYVVEVYGEASLPVMLEAVRSSETMAEWVTAVSGCPMAVFEEEWQRWVINY